MCGIYGLIVTDGGYNERYAMTDGFRYRVLPTMRYDNIHLLQQSQLGSTLQDEYVVIRYACQVARWIQQDGLNEPAPFVTRQPCFIKERPPGSVAEGSQGDQHLAAVIQFLPGETRNLFTIFDGATNTCNS